MFFEVAFHGNIGVRFFIFPGFLFSLIISITGLNETVISLFILSFVVWLFSFWTCPSPTPLFTTSETVVCCFSFAPRFPRLARIWMLGIRIGSVLERILSTARVIGLEIGIPKLLLYSWILKSRWGFESAWFWVFCILLFRSSCFCLSYSLTVIWITSNWLLFVLCYNCPAPSVESALLINLFLFFSWKWLPLMTLKPDPVHLKCCRWCPADLSLCLC